jgi:Low psii accumulation1 / Rep27
MRLRSGGIRKLPSERISIEKISKGGHRSLDSPIPMTKSPKSRAIDPDTNQPLTPEKYARLRAELKSPYRGLRQFIYLACGASGFIGAFIFLTQLLAGREVSSTIPNFALQIGVVALMVWLFRLEQRASRKL